MSGITVQLIFAFLGTRVPYFIAEPAPAVVAAASTTRPPFNATPSASFSATAQSSLRVLSANSSPNLGPAAAPKLPITAEVLLSRLMEVVGPQAAKHPASPLPDDVPAETESEPPSSPPPASAKHKAPLLELFHFEIMTPLDAAAVLYEDDVLLVLCDTATAVQLVEALQLAWLEVYSGAHRTHQPSRQLPAPFSTTLGGTELAVCTTEERLRNVAHARVALTKPVPLHLSLLTGEFTACSAALEKQTERVAQLKAAAGISPTAESAGGESASFAPSPSAVAERFPLLTELEPAIAAVLSADAESANGAGTEASFALCDQQLSAQQKLLPRAAKQLHKIQQLFLQEQEREGDFAAGEHARALQAFLESADQNRDTAQQLVKAFQDEMTRQLKVVRFLVAHITHLRNIVKKSKREMAALDLILSRLSVALQRPQLLEQAEALLRRRVVLRRAARRQLLLLQETEFNDLQRELDAFSQSPEVQKALPPKVRWYLRAPLPSLHPGEDPVATLLDHALIDRDVDAAQELVERTSVAVPAAVENPAQTAQQITDALLPIERLVQRAVAAEAAAEAYKARIAELEQKLSEMEDGKDRSPKSQDTTETAAFTGGKVDAYTQAEAEEAT